MKSQLFPLTNFVPSHVFALYWHRHTISKIFALVQWTWIMLELVGVAFIQESTFKGCLIPNFKVLMDEFMWWTIIWNHLQWTILRSCQIVNSCQCLWILSLAHKLKHSFIWSRWSSLIHANPRGWCRFYLKHSFI